MGLSVVHLLLNGKHTLGTLLPPTGLGLPISLRDKQSEIKCFCFNKRILKCKSLSCSFRINYPAAAATNAIISNLFTQVKGLNWLMQRFLHIFSLCGRELRSELTGAKCQWQSRWHQQCQLICIMMCWGMWELCAMALISERVF